MVQIYQIAIIWNKTKEINFNRVTKKATIVTKNRSITLLFMSFIHPVFTLSPVS